MDIEENLRGIMADILDLPVEKISSATSKESTASWDSLAQINIANALEEEFAMTFSVEEIEEMTSFDDILATLSRKL
jgi:acyl carrier protein